MPLTPEELAEKRRNREAPAIEGLIDEIDKAMIDGFDGARFTWGKIPRSPFVIVAIFRAYEAKGWDVRWVDDQREGNYWEFTPKGNR